MRSIMMKRITQSICNRLIQTQLSSIITALKMQLCINGNIVNNILVYQLISMTLEIDADNQMNLNKP